MPSWALPTREQEPAPGWLLDCLRLNGGMITVAQYMDVVLTHPVHGYYRRRDAIGAAGDFVTAPEISQVFGELIGIWCLAVWDQMGRPSSWRLVELGPGRGTLMRDLVRALQLLPMSLPGLTIEFVDISEALIACQKRTLADLASKPRWCSDFDASDQPTVIIGNEYLDALPVTQLVRRDGTWFERCVGVDGEDILRFVDGAPYAGIVPAVATPAEDGDIVETRRHYASLCGRLAAQSQRGPMAALFIDYGHLRSAYGDTLQAVRNHAYVSPLAAPGTADLSAQVDFQALAKAGHEAGLTSVSTATQGAFLGRLGIAERAARLARTADARARVAIETGIARLICPEAMGGRFKVIGLATSGSMLPVLAEPILSRSG